MVSKFASLAVSAGVFLSLGCGKKEVANVPEQVPAEVAALVPAKAALAHQLGFATRVPKDADLFVAGYRADQMMKGLVGQFSGKSLSANDQREMEELANRIGDESFVFVGPGAGGELEMIGTTYRTISAAWGGFAVGSMLDALGKSGAEPDFAKLAESLSDGLMEKWLDVVEKDSRFQIPSVVMGWKPGVGKEAECREFVADGLDKLLVAVAKKKPVSFEASGVALAGYEIPFREVFGQAIDEARTKLAENAESAGLLEKISPERIERLLAAMENVRFTIATGVTDGRVILYFGNGQDAFRLAATPAESLAASADFQWIADFADKRIAGAAYFSKPMVAAVLPWLDMSEYWQALAKAVRPPLKNERMLLQILNGLAENARGLAKRDVSAWSAIACEDGGLRYESHGGWPDPSLDYETPLRMTDAALVAKPAIRAQWVQNRAWNDLKWQRLEQLGVLADTIFGELKVAGNPMLAMAPDGVVPRAIMEIKAINHAYRDEFRAGIGDEVAFIADFQGEIPTVPGISEETIADEKAPRFVLARPIRDRALVDAAGKSLATSWRGLTAWATELSGTNLPLILPQSIESNGLVTWYPPAPFIGGDFVPGVSLNDDVWMLGTSRSMAGNFAKAFKASSGNGGTGMLVEIDAAPIREWVKSMYRRNQAEADSLAADAPEEFRKIRDENKEQLTEAANRFEGISYRKWLEDGQPRTSLQIKFGKE